MQSVFDKVKRDTERRRQERLAKGEVQCGSPGSKDYCWGQETPEEEKLRKEAKRQTNASSNRGRKERERSSAYLWAAVARATGEVVEEHERESWKAFELMPGPGLGVGDVPFPEDLSFTAHIKLERTARRSALKTLIMRWHPDKFLQKFRERFCPKVISVVEERVTNTFQAIQAAFQKAEEEDYFED